MPGSRNCGSRFTRLIRSAPKSTPSTSKPARSFSESPPRRRSSPAKLRASTARRPPPASARPSANKAAASLEQEQKKVEAVVHELGAQLIVRQHEVSELAEAATRARVAMGQVREQRSGVSRELATARQAAAQTQMEIQRLAGEIEAVAGRVSDAQLLVGANGGGGAALERASPNRKNAGRDDRKRRRPAHGIHHAHRRSGERAGTGRDPLPPRT